MTMRDLVIVGAGGFGAEAVWAAEEINACAASAGRPRLWNILGYADSDLDKAGQIVYGYRVLGTLEEVAKQYGERPFAYYCSIGDNRLRDRMVQRIKPLGWMPATLVHPSVIQAKGVEIGEGTYVGAGSILCPNAKIGAHVIINVHVSIGHDSVIGDFTQVCPGARINGECQLDKFVLIGSNASLLQRTRIGLGATVGANSQVVRPVDPFVTVAGVPARAISRHPKGPPTETDPRNGSDG